MINSLIKYIYCFSLFLLFFSHTASAAVVNSFLNPTSGTTTLPEFLNDFYNFSIMISGIIAVLMIVVGGIYFIFSGAMPDKEREGKEIILGALWGLTLLLGAYFILKVVNPELTTLKDPGGEFAKNVDYENCRAPKKTGDGGDNQINIIENLPFCGLGEYPIDSNGKCICYITDQWETALKSEKPDGEEVDGSPITIQGCENPYKDICDKYDRKQITANNTSLAEQCGALGNNVPNGLVKSDFGGYINPTVWENYKKAIECVNEKHPEYKGRFSFNEGWRSPASMYNKNKKGIPYGMNGMKAAFPCCSNHASGCAIDIHVSTGKMTWAISNSILKECMNKFGLKAEITTGAGCERAGDGECWHFSPSGH